jgi:hypothetical protein
MTKGRSQTKRGRWLRAGGLLGDLSALALGWVEMLERASRERERQGPRDAPWHFSAITGGITGTGLREAETSDAGTLLPLLFVTRTCRWCRQELQMWASMTASEALSTHARPWIFSLDDTSPKRSTLWLPDALRRRWRPGGRELAELAGVARVPTTLWIDALDTVRVVVVGRSRPETALSLLRGQTP